MAQMTRKEGCRHAGTTWCSAMNCANNKRRMKNMLQLFTRLNHQARTVFKIFKNTESQEKRLLKIS